MIKSIYVLAGHILASDIIGGGDRVFLELCKCWQKMGVQVNVVCSKEDYILCHTYGFHANYLPLSSSRLQNTPTDIVIPLIFLLRALKTCSYFWKKIKADPVIVYTPGDFICNIIPAAWSRIIHPRTRWVTHVFFVIPPPTTRKISFIKDTVSFFLQRISFFLIKHCADLVIVLDSTTAKQLKQYGIPGEKIYKSSGGVNIVELERAPRKAGIEYDACFLGRLHPGKGTEDLIKIWKIVTDTVKDAKLAVIGCGSAPYVNAFKKAIEREKLESNIYMLGFLSKPFEVVKSSKILVYPDHEAGYGWGLAICEALACGVPVVAYNLPAYREAYKDGIIFIRFKDIKQFAENILYLLQNEDEKKLQV